MRTGLFAAAALLLATACNAAMGGGTRVELSGVNGQRDFQAGGFDRVELAGPMNVQVNVGGQASVRAEGDTALIDKLDIRVEGGRLRIGLQDGYSWPEEASRIVVHVGTPTLAGANVAGSGDIRVSPVQGQSFAGSVAGSGNLVLDRLQVETAMFDVAGSGNVEAQGAALEARIGIAGSGNARLSNLEAGNARISVAGSGNAALRATGTAAVNIVGSGDVVITGGARCDVSRVGSGDVRCS